MKQRNREGQKVANIKNKRYLDARKRCVVLNVDDPKVIHERTRTVWLAQLERDAY